MIFAKQILFAGNLLQMEQQAVAVRSTNTSDGVKSTMKGTSQFKQFWYEWFHESFIDLFCKGWRTLEL